MMVSSRCRALVSFAGLSACLLGVLFGNVAGATKVISNLADRLGQSSTPATVSERVGNHTKIAEGEYAIFEEGNGGAVGFLWPISPFSLSGITRAVEQDRSRSTQVDLVRIEQPSTTNPVEATILGGPLGYLGDEDIDAAGQKWRARKFSLKVALHPEFLIWTSSKGLLLALAVEHEHKDWPQEGMKLTRFRSWADF